MARLCVNIDHVATIRQARQTYEPDPVWAAVEAQLGGASGITMHLREDRRHIQDADLPRVKEACQVGVNLEMAATDEMVEIATAFQPDLAMLVPEGRDEVTTEGGLDIKSQVGRITEVVGRLCDGGLRVSAFVDAEPAQIQAAAAAGFSVCELHTGPYAHAFHATSGCRQDERLKEEMRRLEEAAQAVTEAGMQLNAGHGLNYQNVQPVASLPGLVDLHIGHAVISRSVLTGMRRAVSEMVGLIRAVTEH